MKVVCFDVLALDDDTLESISFRMPVHCTVRPELLWNQWGVRILKLTGFDSHAYFIICYIQFFPLTTESTVFCYQNCSDILWEKIVLVIKKNFWNSRLKAENLNFLLRSLEQLIQTVKGQNSFWHQIAFLTCSWRFLISNKLEQL